MNFDNFGNGLISLFVLSTMEGWPDYIYTLVDGNGESIGPMKDNQNYIKYLIIFFILVGSIFSVNLFVAMLSMKFDEA